MGHLRKMCGDAIEDSDQIDVNLMLPDPDDLPASSSEPSEVPLIAMAIGGNFCRP